VVDAWRARARHGDRADLLFAALHRCDPLADEAARGLSPGALDAALRGDLRSASPALRQLVDHAAQIPEWVDRERADEAGALFFRSGPAGGITLGAKSLIAGYCSPGGNKPLAFSGQLEARVSGRLAETGRFVVLTNTPGMLEPFAEGWRVTLRVRLMHARVRQLLRRSGRWRDDLWGAPINQHDMAATALLFSVVFLEGIRDFGVHVTPEEAEGYVHLWRWSSWLMGVDEELLPQSEAEGAALVDIIESTQAPPDDDARRLAAALLESPRGALQGRGGRIAEWQIAMGQGFCRALLGDDLADALHLPRTRWRRIVPAVRTALETSRRVLPHAVRRHLAHRAEARGRRYWDRNVELGLAGAAPRFALPAALRGA